MNFVNCDFKVTIGDIGDFKEFRIIVHGGTLNECRKIVHGTLSQWPRGFQ